MDIEPFPFATVDELKDRWPDFPAGGDKTAEILLEDASQFILDVVPSASDASVSTRRRVVCSIVRRAMAANNNEHAGLSQFNVTTGPFTFGGSPSNPHGDFYLTAQERKALGAVRGKAFEIDLLAGSRRARDDYRWTS